MIISHEKRFIFTRGIRVAGVTVKAALSTLCGDGDIISEYNEAEQQMIASLGLRQDQNNRKGTGEEVLKSAREYFSVGTIYDLFPGIEDYDVIGVCRNPYDLAFSAAKWFLNCLRYPYGLSNKPATSDMVCNMLPQVFQRGRIKEFLSDIDIYRDPRTRGPVTILRFENLDNDLSRVFEKYGAVMPELLKTRSTNEVCHLPWQEVFKRKEIDFINSRFSGLFELYGYEML